MPSSKQLKKTLNWVVSGAGLTAVWPGTCTGVVDSFGETTRKAKTNVGGCSYTAVLSDPNKKCCQADQAISNQA